MAQARAVREIDVSVPAVWAILADHRGMSRWAPGLKVELERDGEPAPNGVGAIRTITGPATHIREEVTAFEPEVRLAYRALSGVPLPDWRGEVELAEHGAGTVIRWSLSCRSPLPGIDFLLRGMASVLLAGLVRAVRKHAPVSS